MSVPLADDATVRIRFNFSNVRDYHATIEPAKFVDDTMDVPRLKDLVHLKAFLAKGLDLGLGNTTLEFCTFTVYCPPQFGVNMKDKQTFADLNLHNHEDVPFWPLTVRINRDHTRLQSLEEDAKEFQETQRSTSPAPPASPGSRV